MKITGFPYSPPVKIIKLEMDRSEDNDTFEIIEIGSDTLPNYNIQNSLPIKETNFNFKVEPIEMNPHGAPPMAMEVPHPITPFSSSLSELSEPQPKVLFLYT